MLKKIFIPQAIAIEGEEFLISKGYEIYRGNGDVSKEGLIEDIKEADALILRALNVDAEIIKAGKKLKIIARHGAGYDNIDLKACKEAGVCATFSPNSTTLSVAEFTIASILHIAKKFKVYEEMVRTGNYNERFVNKCSDVSEKTLGIIGYGKIGQLVARKAALGLDMKVVTLARKNTVVPDYVRAVDMDTLLKTSDFISLHVPYTENTKDLISFEEFNKMKNNVNIINVSRGGVMNEEAFVSAVKNNKIAGGVIDVFYKEPPNIDDEIFKLENVVLTPHIASNTEEGMIRIAMDCVVDVHRVLSAEEPLNPIV